MAASEILTWLDSHINLEARAGKISGLSLDAMQEIISLLDRPQDRYVSLHITGTNGKGSTAHLSTRLLNSAGLKVGTYFSPHVSSLNERIQIDGQPISDEDLEQALGRIKSLEPLMSSVLSWFEIMTAAALYWFARSEVDAAVIEVGKLGRFDATNVIKAAVCVITNISEDHTDGKGQWQRAIAWEKAGIIDPGCKLILGENSKELRPIFLEEKPGQVLVLGEDLICLQNDETQTGRILSIKAPIGEIGQVFLSLYGAHQGANATLALGACSALLETMNRPLLSHHEISEAFEEANLPGRFEVIGNQPQIILDGAHNPEGALAAKHTLSSYLTEIKDLENTALIFGLTSGRSGKEMLDSLEAKSFQRVICSGLNIPKGQDPKDLAAAARDMGIEAEVAAAPNQALEMALDNDFIFVAGSLYLVGDIRKAYLDLKLVESN